MFTIRRVDLTLGPLWFLETRLLVPYFCAFREGPIPVQGLRELEEKKHVQLLDVRLFLVCFSYNFSAVT